MQNILLNNLWVKEEITMEIRKYFELNENICGIQLKSCFRGRDIALNTYIRKE